MTTVMNRLANIKLKRIPLDEVELILIARNALDVDEGFALDGVLSVYANRLSGSSDPVFA